MKLELSTSLLFSLLSLFAGACRTTPAAEAADAAAPPVVASLPTYPGMGSYHRHVSTESDEAQHYFDQGLQLVYGFNHDEAIRSFRQAAALDPDCVMAYWGIAHACGIHVNNTQMSEAKSSEGYEAAQEALRRIERASPVEAALVRAVAARFAWPIPEDRRPLDEAYAEAMGAAWREHGYDPDVGALYAESLMNLQPWDYWTREGEPKGRAEEIVATLERVLEIRDDHPGANHFYIHAVEASKDPGRAVAAADRLGPLVPGSGHLVHMPSHIYIRLGRYGDAADTNERAIEVDRAYFAVAPPPDFYSIYFVHNIHFLAYAAMMEARFSTAIEAARRLEREIPEAFVSGYPQIADGFLPTPLHVLVRFGKWQEILEEPEAPEFRRLSRAARHYARGVALSNLGDPAGARAELAAFDAEAALVPEDWSVGNNSAHVILPLARAMLEGEILYREGKIDEAFASLRDGVRREDELVYDEPPGWLQPVRHALGALLLAADRPVEAEQVYREDLARNAGNGWSMLGLELALRRQDESSPEATTLAEARAKVWARSDVQPTSSCYCAP
jgi:tetratricopeptide (TPR) repeat protein